MYSSTDGNNGNDHPNQQQQQQQQQTTRIATSNDLPVRLLPTFQWAESTTPHSRSCATTCPWSRIVCTVPTVMPRSFSWSMFKSRIPYCPSSRNTSTVVNWVARLATHNAFMVYWRPSWNRRPWGALRVESKATRTRLRLTTPGFRRKLAPWRTSTHRWRKRSCVCNTPNPMHDSFSTPAGRSTKPEHFGFNPNKKNTEWNENVENGRRA
mmetsp:Transcript_11186/g.23612  ORF Transcript_11186/g.23612 Transcript_11186/m.23612 type:complete len:210 (-) Transcript_11186:1684-2313(-)